MKVGTHQNLGALLAYHASQRQQRFAQQFEGNRQFPNIQTRGVDTFTRAAASLTGAQGLRSSAPNVQSEALKAKFARSVDDAVSASAPGSSETSQAQSSEPRTYSQADVDNLLKVFGAVEGDDAYDPAMDMNTDGKIGVEDLNSMLSNMASQEPEPAQNEPVTYSTDDVNNLVEIMGSVEGDDAFDAAMDMNADGKIDVDDLNYMLAHADESAAG